MIKPKKCRHCGNLFTPRVSMQVSCSVDCAIGIAKKKRVKSDKVALSTKKRELIAAKQAIKSRSDWMKEAQQAFNAWIRERDKDLPCISCQRHHTGQYHAGHYRTTKAAPELRFNENNVNKQCSVCNNHLSGNILEYRINLIRKIGIELVEWLEGAHQPKKYTIDDLKAIKSEYKEKLKQLTKANNERLL
jgi:hypothetical protein